MTIACAKKPSEIIKLRAKAEMKPYTVRITNLYNSSVGSEVPNVWKLQINQINQYVVRFVESWMIKLAIINGNGEGPKYGMSRKKTNYGITGNMEMLGWGRVHNTFTRGLKTSTGRKELSSISSVSKTLLSGKYDSSELRTLIENAKDNLPSTNLSKILNSFANNFGRFAARIHWILRYSCALTIATKMKLKTLNKVFSKYGKNLSVKDEKGSSVTWYETPKGYYKRPKKFFELS